MLIVNFEERLYVVTFIHQGDTIRGFWTPRFTKCTIAEGGTEYYDYANCNPNDNFSYKTGRTMSLARTVRVIWPDSTPNAHIIRARFWKAYEEAVKLQQREAVKKRSQSYYDQFLVGYEKR